MELLHVWVRKPEWPPEKACSWYKKHPRPVGLFIPGETTTPTSKEKEETPRTVKYLRESRDDQTGSQIGENTYIVGKVKYREHLHCWQSEV